MGIIKSAVSAAKNVISAAKNAVSGNKNSSSNSSNKNSSSNSSNKNSSSNSSNKNSSSNSGAKVGTGSVAPMSSTPSISSGLGIGSITGGSSSSSNKSSGGSSSSSNKSSGGSSSSSTKISGTTPVASAVGGGTILANGTVVGGSSSSSKTSSGGSSSSSTKISGTTPVASMAGGGTRLANGTVVGGSSSSKTSSTNKSSGGGSSSSLIGSNIGLGFNANPLSQLASTVQTQAAKSVISNGRQSVDLTKNNALGSPAVASTADGGIRYADGSTYNPTTGVATAPTKSTSSVNNNKIQSPLKSNTNLTKTNSLSTSTGGMSSYDYTKQNAKGSPAVASGADGTIRYADGSVYNPKTGVTTNPDGSKVKDVTQASVVTEGDARNDANTKANNASTGNSSTYNNISTPSTKQNAMSVVLNQNGGNGGMKSDSLDVGDGSNRKIGSQEGLNNNGDGTFTYIAPNGKTYDIVLDDKGDYAYQSKTDGGRYNVTTDGNVNNNIKDITDFLKSNNDIDGINRSNVDNKDAVKGATIEGTYTAPSGKEYDILTNGEGKVGFININGDAQWFDSQEKALNYIDSNNPVGSKDLSKNTPKPEWQSGVNEAVENMNEEVEDREEDDSENIQALKDELMAEIERLREMSDENYGIKNQIIQSMFNDIDTFDNDINNAIADLQEKSDLLNDNEKMRWARQRAAQLAAQGYLTSEQVAQVANYSLADYNKELQASAIEAAKAIAELRVNIIQKKQDYINAIRSQQFANENDRQTQINYISDRFDKVLTGINDKENQISQFYGNIYNSNLAMNAQNELGYESIIKQNDAQNIANDRNKQKAYTDTEYRRQYILNNIPDANLQVYANQAINYLINNGNFIFPGKSNADNNRILAEQISKITDAARQLQLENQKDLAKVS